MERIGKIGNGRRRIPLFIKILCIPLLLSLILFFLNDRLHCTATRLAQSELSLFFSSAVTKTVSEEIVSNDLTYRDLITLTYKADGDVASLEADMPRLISLQTAVCNAVFATYKKVGTLSVSVPVSLLFGIDFFSGDAASIDVRVLPTKTLHAYCTSEFDSAGINQTRHRIIFHVEGSFILLFPAGEERVNVSESYCVAETLIVGKVPDAYTEISRLTDGVIESDIDDIYDFGATID